MISRSAFGNAEVSSTAKAAAANKAAISSAAPTASTTRLVVLFVLTFFFLSWSLVHLSLASSIDRRSWRDRWRKPGVALPVHPPPPLWACLHKQMVPAGHSGLLLSVSFGMQSILCCSAPRAVCGEFELCGTMYTWTLTQKISERR